MLNLRVLRPEDKVEGKAIFIFFSKLWLENTLQCIYTSIYIIYLVYAYVAFPDLANCQLRDKAHR